MWFLATTNSFTSASELARSLSTVLTKFNEAGGGESLARRKKVGLKETSIIRESSIYRATNFPIILKKCSSFWPTSVSAWSSLIGAGNRPSLPKAYSELSSDSFSRHNLSFFLENSLDTVE